MFISHVCSATDETYIRKLYYESLDNKDSAEKFVEIMQNVKFGNNPLMTCFKGMSYMTMSKHTLNPYNKLSYFNKGKDLLEKAVQMKPNNLEIRFMRFCVQTNVPSLLGYHQEMAADKEFIISSWKSCNDTDLKSKIRQYMLHTSYCSSTEKLNFK